MCSFKAAEWRASSWRWRAPRRRKHVAAYDAASRNLFGVPIARDSVPANGFGVGMSPGHGQTTVKNGHHHCIDLLMTTAELRFCGADDGNRTRVFSLGSRFSMYASSGPPWWQLRYCSRVSGHRACAKDHAKPRRAIRQSVPFELSAPWSPGPPAAYRAVIVAGYLVALGIQGKNADEYLKRTYVPPDKRRRLGRF